MDEKLKKLLKDMEFLYPCSVRRVRTLIRAESKKAHYFGHDNGLRRNGADESWKAYQQSKRGRR